MTSQRNDCSFCGHAEYFEKKMPPLPRAEVIVAIIGTNLMALIAAFLWRATLLSGGFLPEAIAGWLAFGLTLWWLGQALPWYWKYLQRNVRPHYLWYSLDAATDELHAHLEEPKRGYAFRIKVSGWFGRNTAVLEGWETSRHSWRIVRRGDGYVLKGRPEFYKTGVCSTVFHDELRPLIRLAERGPINGTITDLLTADEAHYLLYAFIRALCEIIKSPDYARSRYAQFVGDVLEQSWPEPLGTVASDPRYARAFDTWRVELRRRADTELPKRKVAAATV